MTVVPPQGGHVTLIAVADDRIHRVFFHADVRRLRYLGPGSDRS